MEKLSISAVLSHLVKESGLQVKDIALQANVKPSTLYSLIQRDSDRASISVLKALADFFDEDLEVFCGEPSYQRKPRLTQEEEQLLTAYRSLGQKDKPLMIEAASMPAIQKQLMLGIRQLNSQGQQKLLDNCEDLIASGRYKA